MNASDNNLTDRLQWLEVKSSRLEEENDRLREENRLLKLQIEELRQKFFKKNTPKPKDNDPPPSPKKRGAPVGHIGTTRKTPDYADEHVDVRLDRCPECGGTDLHACQRYEDHYQEDMVLPQVKVTRFRHHFYYCRKCQAVVHGVGQGELPNSYIGPVAKSVAAFLRYQMKIPYRKVRQLFQELFHLAFVPSSAPGFDRQIRNKGSPVYKKLKENLVNQPFVHVDETGWRNEGVNHWLWCFITRNGVVYHIDRSRGGKVVVALLGQSYAGVLISDFLAAYNQIKARKQRCLVHLLRLIKKWQVYFAGDRKRSKHFTYLKKQVKSILALSKQMGKRRPKRFIDRKADLIAGLRRALQTSVAHPRADKFLRKLSGRINELVTCLDDPQICAHNNLAERLLRDNVIMRKITFGNRSFYEDGQQNHAVLMSLIQTARQRNINPLTFLHLLLTQPAVASAVLLPVSDITAK